MSFGYCSPPHLISTIPTSYLNNYLSYEQTDWFRQFYELIRTIPDTLLIYNFWQHFDHVSLCGKLYNTPKKLFDPPRHLLIPRGTYWYPTAPIDTPPSCIISPRPCSSCNAYPNQVIFILLESKKSDLQDGIICLSIYWHLFVKNELYILKWQNFMGLFIFNWRKLH